MKLKKRFLAGGLALTLFFAACNKDDDNDTASAQDRTFIAQASMSNNAEIQMGNLALTKSSDAGVRKFAQMMVTDHTAAQADLRNITNNLSISISDTIGTANTNLMTLLGGLSGRAFDTVYIKNQRTAHQLTLANFQTEISNGSHPQVKGYASDKLPAIQMHLNMTDTIYTRIK
ncbi:MAG: DUF4142 domain-containing protein [Bacteroidota bacterium]|nr:DUF4142 domain-containing protein [Flavisolibacter sp.]MBD0351622.1 DUF4142 domain-containing protein [Flavisolibacter sp.]MBD0366573.1 DUF4142 domain-containing protein [Flavisolibacter sp.]MBD0375251.1 DUF4142 domain-containing protein [Flavisolibacter sp.]MDQ3843911.1 DUF4142 domain-containing protein [Bacteroidota bacterium]